MKSVRIKFSTCNPLLAYFTNSWISSYQKWGCVIKNIKEM
jgi:hypothetical protein